MANSAYKGLEIEVGANTKEASRALRDIEKQAQGTTKELRQISNALKVDPGNVKLLERQQEIYNQKLDVSRQKLEALKKLEAQGQDSMSSQQWTALQADIARTTQEISKYETEIKKIDLTPKLEASQKAIQGTEKELEALNKALKLDPSNTELVAQKQDTLKRAISQSKEQLEQLETVQERLSKEEIGEEEWSQLQADIINCRSELQEYENELKDISHVTEEATRNSSEMIASAGDALQQGSRKVSNFGDAYTRTVTAGIAGAAVAGVKSAKDIDDALTSVRKTVDGTEEDYRRLEEAAIAFSQTNAVGADTILELDALGAQLGFSLEELQKFGEVASGLDIATDMDAETAATEMAQFANITKMAHSDIERYASTIVELGNNLATTESKVSSMAQRVGAAGSQVGLTQQEILGWSAAMSSLGIEAEAGGTAFSTTISSIDKAVASGGEALDKYAAIAGMTADEFKDSWSKSASDTFKVFLDGLSNVDNMSVTLEELGITGIRQTDVMKRLAGNTELVADAIGLANKGWQENKALSNEVANKNSSLSAKFEILLNRLKAVAIEIGEPLVDALIEVLEASEPVFEMIEDGAKAFKDLDKEQQQAIISMVGMVAAVGPLLSATGRIGGAVGSAMSALGNLGTDLKLFFANGGKMAEGMTGALTSLKGGMIGVGVAAAGMLIAFGIEQLVEYQQDIERTASASRNLADMESEIEKNSSGAGEAVKTFAGFVVGSKSDVEKMTDSVKQLKDEAGKMRDEFVEKMTDISVDAGSVEHYIDVIEELTKKEELNETEQYKLKTAVEQYNEITGGSLEIIELETGKINQSTEALKLNKEAWKQAAREKVYQETIANATEQVVEAEMKLPEANRILEETKKRYEELNAQLAENPALIQDSGWELEQLSQYMAEAQRNVNALNAQIENNNQLIDDSCDKMAEEKQAVEQLTRINDLAEMFKNFGEKTTEAINNGPKRSIEDLAKEFDNAGVHMDDLQRVSDEDFAQIYRQCQGNVDLIVRCLDELNAKKLDEKRLEINDMSVQEAIQALKDLNDYTLEEKELLIREKLAPGGEWVGPVPLFANGAMFSDSLGVNGILRTPTMLSQGIFGEAGDEALVSWRGGSTAIPLTNEQAVEPLARTIAKFVDADKEPSEVNTYIVNVDGTQWNNQQVIDETVADFITEVARKGAMNCG